MITSHDIMDLLSAPLDPDWTVEVLAEKVLTAVVALPADADEFVIVVDEATNHQLRRLMRPLLACLATKSATESGKPVNLYGGQLSFQRTVPTGPVWVLGEFENRPGCVRLVLRRSSSPPALVETESANGHHTSTALNRSHGQPT